MQQFAGLSVRGMSESVFSFAVKTRYSGTIIGARVGMKGAP
jgi:hypothetical protein